MTGQPFWILEDPMTNPQGEQTNKAEKTLVNPNTGMPETQQERDERLRQESQKNR